MRERLRWAGGALFAACLFVLPAVSAHAGLLRCMGPDGKMIYTDNQALCPNAKPFEPEGEIHYGSKPSAGPAAIQTNPLQNRLRRAKARLRAAEEEEEEERRWRDKKLQLEQKLVSLDEREAYLARFVTLCNRGGWVMTRDESGIKRRVKCRMIKSQFTTVGLDQARVQADLDGLPDECRRAGCLPGWLR